MSDDDLFAESLARSSGIPNMLAARVDLLSQMLALVRLQGELVFSAELTAPWALRFDGGSAYFVVVSEGEVTIRVGSEPAVRAASGDLLMLPRGLNYVISDGSGRGPISARQLMEEQFTAEQLSLRYGGNGPLSKLMIGAFHFESAAMPWVISSLPAVLHLPKSAGATAGWLEGLAHFMMVEAHEVHPGSSLMISRLIDVLVIRILRTWTETEKDGDAGWLGALTDIRISRALKALHDEPFKRWTVAELGRIAGMSRSSFAERFTALVKEPPVTYQSHWRLTLANDLLRQEELRVSDVARQIGYDSEAAFSRAFKTRFGITPMQARGLDLDG